MLFVLRPMSFIPQPRSFVLRPWSIVPRPRSIVSQLSSFILSPRLFVPLKGRSSVESSRVMPWHDPTVVFGNLRDGLPNSYLRIENHGITAQTLHLTEAGRSRLRYWRQPVLRGPALSPVYCFRLDGSESRKNCDKQLTFIRLVVVFF